MKFASSMLAEWIKSIAEGSPDHPLTKLYWKLAGRKRVIALVIAAIYGLLSVAVGIFSQCVPECATAAAVAQFEYWLSWAPYAVAFLVSVGLYDAAIRIDPPKKGDYVTPPKG